MFTDIAGLNDADGELIDLVNCFVNKKIFNIASKVKFLIPFSYNQIYDSRGKNIMDHVETVMALCENSQLQELTNSILPVITRCPVTDDNDIDLDELKDQVLKRLKKDLQVKEDQERITIMDRNSSSASPFSTSAGSFGEQDIEQIDEDI